MSAQRELCEVQTLIKWPPSLLEKFDQKARKLYKTRSELVRALAVQFLSEEIEVEHNE